MNTRPRIARVRVGRFARGSDFPAYFGIVYARNGKRWAELGPYAFPEAAELAARDWATREGFEVQS